MFFVPFQLFYGACFLSSPSEAFFPTHKAASRRRQTLAHNLNTAFEWLASERALKHDAYTRLSWIDPSNPFDDIISRDDDALIGMPLYPLGATYLPSETIQILNNVQPRNIKMALDLIRHQDRRFCVVLCATDTGRISSEGTVMQVINMDIQEGFDGEIRRILLQCRPEKVVTIESILNPEAFSPENRILMSNEYLKARVRVRPQQEFMPQSPKIDALIAELIRDYNVVRNLYQEGTGKSFLPHFASNFSESMPEWTANNFKTELDLWKTAEIWQTLCNTVREGSQMLLSADRNEAMVAAAMTKSGPLKLPIHMEDLEPNVRRQLVDMEVQGQADFQMLGMDPCLDFQALLGLEQVEDRLHFLCFMVLRERTRLESLPQIEVNVIKVQPRVPQKGAWFESEFE
jgi:hypothetical protein